MIKRYNDKNDIVRIVISLNLSWTRRSHTYWSWNFKTSTYSQIS